MAVVRRVCICGLIHTLIYIIELAKKRHFEFNTDALESQTNRIISQWIPSYFTAIHNYVKRFRSPNEYRWNSASTTSAKNILHHENSRNLILQIGSINTVKAKLAFISYLRSIYTGRKRNLFNILMFVPFFALNLFRFHCHFCSM